MKLEFNKHSWCASVDLTYSYSVLRLSLPTPPNTAWESRCKISIPLHFNHKYWIIFSKTANSFINNFQVHKATLSSTSVFVSAPGHAVLVPCKLDKPLKAFALLENGANVNHYSQNRGDSGGKVQGLWLRHHLSTWPKQDWRESQSQVSKARHPGLWTTKDRGP